MYQSKVYLISSKQVISPTLSKLLSYISPALSEKSLPAILIGNIITSYVSKHYTDLQIALAVMVQRKQTVARLYDYGVVCSYDELVCFSTSVAAWSVHRQLPAILHDHSQGLVQAVADNFDCNISSMNGLKQIHPLAIMLLQQDQGGSELEIRESEGIPRRKKKEIKDVQLPDIEPVQYTGPKKPLMPKGESRQNVPTLKVLVMVATALTIAAQNDLQFYCYHRSYDTRVLRLQHKACS